MSYFLFSDYGDSDGSFTPHHSLVPSTASTTLNGRKPSEVLKMKRVSTTSETAIRTSVEKHRERESRAATTFGIIVGAFLICWLPFFIWMPLTALMELHTPPLLYNIILWVGYGNSAINPFIYGIFNRDFRNILLRNLRKCSRYLWSTDSGP